jgi:cytoskeletal protein CcmA (bactofilin family)
MGRPDDASRERVPPASGAGGRTVVIKGELKATEDLRFEGRIEGRVELAQHVLTVGAGARIQGEIAARSVIVQGEVAGDITAAERLQIAATGSVEGDVTAPTVAIVEGAHFRGRIEMPQPGEGRPAPVAGRSASPPRSSRPESRAAIGPRVE